MAMTYEDGGVNFLNGSAVMILIGGQPIAYAKTSNMELSADSSDTSNKMSGAFKSAMPGALGWQLSSDFFFSAKEGHLSFDTLFSKMVERKSVEVVFGQIKEEAGDFKLDTTKISYKGKAAILSLSMKTDHGSYCEGSVSLTGAGPLEQTAKA